MRRRLVGGLTAIALALLVSCGSRGELTFSPQVASVGDVQTVIVSTARTPIDAAPFFTSGRSFEPHFARFQISVPPKRQVGTITFVHGGVPDPDTDFLVVSARRLRDKASFVGAVNNELMAKRPSEKNALVFVHGFNTNFAEGLYRQAQLTHDLDRRGASIHFAWPSAAKLQGYAYDRESALFARDALEETVAAVAASKARSVTLAAHSMGTFLLMDTLRLMARTGNDQVFSKLNAVILISPDIGIDVFREEAVPVLARGVPIYIIVSDADRALKLSARLRGEHDRLGSIRSAAELGGLKVVVVDLSAVESEDLVGHFKVGSSPAVIDFVRGLHRSGLEVFRQGARPGVIEFERLDRSRGQRHPPRSAFHALAALGSHPDARGET